MADNTIPSYLEGAIVDTGTQEAEVLMRLAVAVGKQNAILDDTIHGELKRMADAQEQIARQLPELIAALRSIR